MIKKIMLEGVLEEASKHPLIKKFEDMTWVCEGVAGTYDSYKVPESHESCEERKNCYTFKRKEFKFKQKRLVESYIDTILSEYMKNVYAITEGSFYDNAKGFVRKLEDTYVSNTIVVSELNNNNIDTIKNSIISSNPTLNITGFTLFINNKDIIDEKELYVEEIVVCSRVLKNKPFIIANTEDKKIFSKIHSKLPKYQGLFLDETDKNEIKSVFGIHLTGRSLGAVINLEKEEI